MNIIKLNKEVSQTMKHVHIGAPSTKKDTIKVLSVFIDTLKNSGALLRSVNHIGPFHLRSAVEEWKSQEIKNSTIKNRISAIRRFCKYQGIERDIPTASYLNIYVKRKKIKLLKVDINEIINKLSHPISIEIAKRQAFFGLTKKEAIQIKLKDSIVNNTILVPRSISNNNFDRVIPVLTDSQKDIRSDSIIDNLVIEKKYMIIKRIYETDRLLSNIDKNLNLRYCYPSLRPDTDIITLCKETGISKKTIVGILNHESI